MKITPEPMLTFRLYTLGINIPHWPEIGVALDSSAILILATHITQGEVRQSGLTKEAYVADLLAWFKDCNVIWETGAPLRVWNLFIEHWPYPMPRPEYLNDASKGGVALTKRRDMANIESAAMRESTKREMIDQRLLVAVELARANNQAILRLRDALLGSPADTQKPERAARPGWFGEIQDGLEMVNEYLENTAKTIQEIQAQVATPTPNAPSRT